MSAIAQEVSRRMTPGYAKERAKEMARHRAIVARDRAVDSPWIVPLIGAGVGVLIGRAVLSRAQERRDREWRREEWERPVRYGLFERYPRSRFGEERGYARAYRPQGAHGASAEWDEDLALASQEPGGEGEGSPGVKERLSQKASEVGDRAADVKDRLGSKAGEVSGRVSQTAHELGDRVRGRAGALRERIPDREAMRSRAYEQPGLWALGAAAIGALFGLALPLSDAERQVLEPAKEKVREASRQVMDRAVATVEGHDAPTSQREQPGAGLGTTPADPGLAVPPGPGPIH